MANCLSLKKHCVNMSDPILIKAYQALVNLEQIQKDPAQEWVLSRMVPIYDALTQPSWQRMWRKPAVRGLYLWGSVGRGKTFLLDLFFEQVPIKTKTRWHFHRFMQYIHATLQSYAQQKNPLERLAKEIAKNTTLLVFDELFVQDIADAMLLGGLFTALFQEGVVMLATSNVPPDDLYKNGLQRSQFLPAIAAIKKHTEVYQLDHTTDYRLHYFKQLSVYFCPLDKSVEAKLTKMFEALTHHAPVKTPLLVEGRTLEACGVGHTAIWVSFLVLCGDMRSVADYIALGTQYPNWIISDIPQLDASQDDCARRFVNLVDECYDRKVKLIISAAVPIKDLYTGQKLKFEFDRTVSRLLEMQSEDYLALPHG